MRIKKGQTVKKNGVEDLKKARWYLNRLINKLDPSDKGV